MNKFKALGDDKKERVVRRIRNISISIRIRIKSTVDSVSRVIIWGAYCQ